MTGGLSKMNRYLLAGASVIGLLAIGSAEAKAQDLKSIQGQIDSLNATVQNQQATIKALQKQVQDAKAQATEAQTTAASAKGSDLDLKVKWKGAPEFSSADGKFKFKVRGRLETDYNSINQDTPVTSFPDVSGTELRRARLGIEGTMFYDWKYVFEVDFANDVVQAKDAYLQYQGLKISDTPVLFRVGNFKTFNSFEEETSDRFVDTMERAAFINAWDLERQIGLGTMYYSEHFGLAAGIFGQRFASTSNAPLFPGFVGNEDTTWAARAFASPINRDVNGVTQVLHFGASFRNRDAGDDQPLFQYGNRATGAALHLANAPIQTGRIGEEDTFWGLEAVGLWGPFSLQGEYANLDVDLPGGEFVRNNPPGANQLTTITNPLRGISSPSYNGWYVEGSWFFGGHKTYEDEGRWGRPKINHPMFHESGGWGALQIVGKYDVLDMGTSSVLGPNESIGSNGFPNGVGPCLTTRLFPGLGSNSNSLQAPGIAECGDMKTWTVTANWWMTEYMRIMFEYSESDLSGYPTTPLVANSTQLASGNVNGFDGGTIRGFGTRFQVDW